MATPALRGGIRENWKELKFLPFQLSIPQQMVPFAVTSPAFKWNLWCRICLWDDQTYLWFCKKYWKEKELDCSHRWTGAIWRLLFERLLGYEQENSANGGLDNASVTILTTDWFWALSADTWNDTSYLEGLKKHWSRSVFSLTIS